MNSATTSLSQRALGSLLWMSSGAGMRAGLRLLVVLVLARLWTPYEFGVAVAVAAALLVPFVLVECTFGVLAVLALSLQRVFLGPDARWMLRNPEKSAPPRVARVFLQS